MTSGSIMTRDMKKTFTLRLNLCIVIDGTSQSDGTFKIVIIVAVTVEKMAVGSDGGLSSSINLSPTSNMNGSRRRRREWWSSRCKMHKSIWDAAGGWMNIVEGGFCRRRWKNVGRCKE